MYTYHKYIVTKFKQFTIQFRNHRHGNKKMKIDQESSMIRERRALEHRASMAIVVLHGPVTNQYAIGLIYQLDVVLVCK